MAVIIQNSHHEKNSQRVEAVTSGTYLDIDSQDRAQQYLNTTLTENLTRLYKAKEKSVEQKYQNEAQDLVIEKVLMAPTVFHSAVMLKEQK